MNICKRAEQTTQFHLGHDSPNPGQIVREQSACNEVILQIFQLVQIERLPIWVHIAQAGRSFVIPEGGEFFPIEFVSVANKFTAINIRLNWHRCQTLGSFGIEFFRSAKRNLIGCLKPRAINNNQLSKLGNCLLL